MNILKIHHCTLEISSKNRFFWPFFGQKCQNRHDLNNSSDINLVIPNFVGYSYYLVIPENVLSWDFQPRSQLVLEEDNVV